MNVFKRHKRKMDKPKSKGQTFVEFAIVLPILLLLILGIIEFGRLMFVYSMVTTSAREAARYGAAVGVGPNGDPYYRDCDGIIQTAVRIGTLVGVDASDVYIAYDAGPDDPTNPLPVCPVPDTDIELGDRIVVEVRGEYNPLPAAPLVNLPVWEFASVSRRTIVKNAAVNAANTAVAADTNTPTPPNTATITPGGPTFTASATATDTPIVTDTPSRTPTPIKADPPIFVSATATPFGLKCNDVQFTFEPNPNWATYPGIDPVFYALFINGIPSGTIAPNDPAPTTWDTNTNMNDGTFVELKVQALFGGPLISEFLTKTFQCVGGLLIDSAAPPVHVEIVVPGDGVTIAGVSSTEFYAVAWDPVVGTTDGDGISSVTFELIHEATGTLIMQSSYFTSQYCVFGGTGPCNRWQSPPVNPAWDWSSTPNGTYRLRARAVSTIGSRTSDWDENVFSIAKPVATSTPTPSPDVIVNIIAPLNGEVICEVSCTAFEAEAWDTGVGTWNGAGIERVEFVICCDSFGDPILSGTQFSPKYCAFTGTDPCNTWTSPPATVSWASLPNGTYTISAQAFAPDGRSSTVDSHAFTK